MLVSIGQAAVIIGVSVSTLRRWERDGRLQPDCRTIGRHRRYRVDSLKEQFGLVKDNSERKDKKTILYARVSSSDQKAALARQISRLEQTRKDCLYVTISD